MASRARAFRRSLRVSGVAPGVRAVASDPVLEELTAWEQDRLELEEEGARLGWDVLGEVEATEECPCCVERREEAAQDRETRARYPGLDRTHESMMEERYAPRR